ncbi:MAG: multiheme c-type cytochrome [Planctomycetota bacterium]
MKLGSLARRKTYLDSVATEGIDPVLVDGGDWLFELGNVRMNKFAERQLRQKAELIVDAYNEFGYDAAAIGEHDLAFGIEFVEALAARARFPFLCANLLRDGAPIFPGSTVIERAGFRVGVIAILMELPDRFLEKYSPGLTVGSHREALARELEKLGDEVDTVVLLGHVEQTDIMEIADTVKVIDFILHPAGFSGNEPTWINDGEEITERNGKVLLKISGQGSTVGRLDLYPSERGAPWHNFAEEPQATGNLYFPTLTRLASHIGKHPGIDALVNEFLKGTRYRGFTEEDLTFVPATDYLTADTCSVCHLEQTEFWRGTGHGKAYQTLVDAESQFRYDCISCHVLGYGETFVDAHAVGPYKDVQCESCHGKNPQHPTAPADHPWPKVNTETCWSCHDPRVTRVPFDVSAGLPAVTCPPLKRN